MANTIPKEHYAAPAVVWDTKTQSYHGGQEFRFIENFIEDFSVTTNLLGIPEVALEAARKAVYTCDHYPAANQEPARTSLAEFLWGNDHAAHHPRLLLGNGASELIDLVVRSAPKGTWKPGPWDVQYKEYQRSAETNGFEILAAGAAQKAHLTCIVNPCNPTGEYMPLPEIKSWITANVIEGGTVIVDESMQPWHSTAFRSDSLTSQHEFIDEMSRLSGIAIYVIHSWTKLWSCTGLRLGSVVCPSDNHCAALKRVQVPWSVNSPALAFLDAVVRDEKYLATTWCDTPILRARLIERLKEIPSTKCWIYHGEAFLSWVWIDTGSVVAAEKAVTLARKGGVPVRSGEPGYKKPTFIRVAVRKAESVDALLKAWEAL